MLPHPSSSSTGGLFRRGRIRGGLSGYSEALRSSPVRRPAHVTGVYVTHPPAPAGTADQGGGTPIMPRAIRNLDPTRSNAAPATMSTLGLLAP